MTKTEKDIVIEISDRLKRGDIGEIAKICNKSREHVGNVLNPNHEAYADDIVDAAINYLKNRENNNKRKLETLSELDLNKG